MDELRSKNILIGVLAFFLIIAGLFVAWKITTKPPTVQKAEVEVREGDRTKGTSGAKVVLIEYSDFQCPACRSYAPIAKQAFEKYEDKMLFVYRHFPLAQHKNAQASAYAAEAAGNQKKFFAMHDMLFENQEEWAESDKPEEIFEGYAKELKLDIKKFKKDVKSDKVKSKVERDRQSGVGARVNSTPSFFLNGEKLDPPRTLEDFEALLKEAVADAKKN